MEGWTSLILDKTLGLRLIDDEVPQCSPKHLLLSFVVSFQLRFLTFKTISLLHLVGRYRRSDRCLPTWDIPMAWQGLVWKHHCLESYLEMDGSQEDDENLYIYQKMINDVLDQQLFLGHSLQAKILSVGIDWCSKLQLQERFKACYAPDLLHFC